MGIDGAAGRQVRLTGVLLCAPSDVALVLRELPEHIRLTRAEPGCLAFDVTQAPDDPRCFEVSERFRDRQAFDAHQARTRASRWGRTTAHIPRDYTVTEGES